ncbi:MAG: hypothetical protein ABFD82_14795 [Syntrophaceae bacterium]
MPIYKLASQVSTDSEQHLLCRPDACTNSVQIVHCLLPRQSASMFVDISIQEN